MKNDIVRIILFTVLFLFLGLYVASQNGYIDYQARDQMVLTEEQIKKFEDDVKNNRPIDIENYVQRQEELYDNQISRMSLNLSNTIGKAVQKFLNFIFDRMEHWMKTE